MPAIRIIDDHVELANIGSNTHAQIDTHIAAADNYVKKDGSLILTADWDIGDGRKILADQIRARDGDGLKLFDTTDAGIFVDAGNTKIYQLDVDQPQPYWARLRINPPSTAAYAIIDFDPQPNPATGDALFRFFRTTNTSGSVSFQVLLGNDSSTANHRLFGDGGDSYLAANNGKVGVGTISPTALLDIDSDILRLRTAKTPASAGAAGNTGDICWDASYFYICVATNTWERTEHATWV